MHNTNPSHRPMQLQHTTSKSNICTPVSMSNAFKGIQGNPTLMGRSNSPDSKCSETWLHPLASTSPMLLHRFSNHCKETGVGTACRSRRLLTLGQSLLHMKSCAALQEPENDKISCKCERICSCKTGQSASLIIVCNDHVERRKRGFDSDKRCL